MSKVKFKGFALIRVIRAINAQSQEVDGESLPFSYEVEIHTNMGKHQVGEVLTHHQLIGQWHKDLGMTKERFAILQSGHVECISEGLWEARRKEWESR